MPTNDGGNGASPTAKDVNASQVDVTTLTAEQLEANPHFQELKKKYSAAHKDMDQTNLSKKELKAEIARLKVIAGEEEAPATEDENAKPVTKAELQQQVWELSHAKDVELYGDEKFQADVASGIPKDYALENAKLRYATNPDNARLGRQQAMASGSSASTRNLESEDLEGFDPEIAKKFGYSKETWLKQKQLKKARGQI